MQISKHFTFNELTHTNHTQFLRRNRLMGERYIRTLRLIANYILEPVRAIFGVPVLVSSCFRCPDLNDFIGGSKNSQHLRGEVPDFEVKGIPCKEVFDIIRIKPHIKYGQLILESAGSVEWIHCSLPTLENNGQILIFENGVYRHLK